MTHGPHYPYECIACKGVWHSSGVVTLCPHCLIPLASARAPESPPKKKKGWANTKLYKIGKRDGWVCHLCKEAVPKPGEVDELHPTAPTRDHLIPRAFGGPNRNSNIKLAHRLCNTKRGCDPLPDVES